MTIIAFLLGIATDAVWTLWSRAANRGRSHFAAGMSVLIFLCSIPWQRAVVVLDVPVIIAYLAGAYLGTWAIVRFTHDEQVVETHCECDICIISEDTMLDLAKRIDEEREEGT